MEFWICVRINELNVRLVISYTRTENTLIVYIFSPSHGR